MNSFEIVFYKTSNNICPVKDFLLNTDIKMRAKLSSLMEILEEYGNLLREPYSTRHLKRNRIGKIKKSRLYRKDDE